MKHLPKFILFAFGFLLYVNTSSYDFALDDKIVITYNKFTKKGTDGIREIFANEAFTGFFGKKKNLVEGGRYRPLTLAYFAIVWEFLGPEQDASARIFEKKSQKVATFLHLSNAFFYGLTGVLLFLCLLLFFENKQQIWYQSLSFWIALLFLAHPVHTEVVANIKSLDEIISLLAGLASLYFSILFIQKESKKYLVFVFICFLLGAFAKESIVVFLGVIPLTLWLFVSKKTEQVITVMVPSVVAFGLYFMGRNYVLGDMSTDGQEQLLNQPFLYANGSQKIASILLCMFMYMKLSLFPNVLTHDYYPWHPLSDDSYSWDPNYFPYAELSNPLVMASVVLYLLLLGYGLRYLFTQKGDKVLAYCSLFFIGTLILFTNLFFEIGVFMNERFLFIPSIAVVVAVVYSCKKFLPKKIAYASLAALCILGSIKTISRNPAWENDQTLAIADYKTSSGSAKVNMSAGGAFYELARLEKNQAKKDQLLAKSIKLLHKSLRLYPNYIQSKTLLGHSYFEAGQYDKSIVAYESGLSQNPNFTDIHRAIFIISDSLSKAKQAPMAAKYLEMLIEKKPNLATAYDKLGQLYGKEMGQLDKSIPMLLKAHELNPKVLHTIENLGVAYGMKGDFTTSLDYFFKALELEPDKKTLMENIAKTYYYMGDQAKYAEYSAKANAMAQAK